MEISAHSNEQYIDEEDDQNFCRRCCNFCYSKKDKTFCKRDKKSWGLLLLYYIMFIFILLAIFSLMLLIIFEIMETKGKPILSINPDTTLSVFPLLCLKSPLIWYYTSDKARYTKYTSLIDKKLSVYKADNVEDCRSARKKKESMYECQGSNCSVTAPSFEVSMRALRENKACEFDVSSLDVCGKHPYGYTSGSPCIYVKLNKKLDWVPKPYTKDSNLPADMPDDIKSLIKRENSKKLWISCEGYNLWDKDNLQSINYFPSQGIDVFYFPYTTQSNQHLPLVAIQIASLNYENMLLTLSCRLWNQGNDVVETLVQIYVRHDNESI